MDNQPQGEKLDKATIAELQRQLASIKRDALGLVRTVELAQGIPPEQSAIRTRAERRLSVVVVNGAYNDRQ